MRLVNVNRSNHRRKSANTTTKPRMKKNKVGFYDPVLQRNLSLRPRKPRKTYARSLFIQTALQRGFLLESTITKSTFIVQPSQCTSLQQVISEWLQHPEMEYKRQAWQECKKKESFGLATGLLRTLNGHVDKKTKKAVYTVASWRIVGIFISFASRVVEQNHLQ